MCGRYVVAYDPSTLVSGFSLTRIQPFDKRWNIAPQSNVPAVYQSRDGERVAELMRWGLIPHWARDPSVGAKLNNARLEGAADKPSFRQALRRRRCLIPASGFYEWQPARDAAGKPFKQPWYFSPADAPAATPWFAFAGLFEAWRPAGATDETPWLLSCCILTREANARMAPVHDRMPVIVPPDHWSAWLARDRQDPDTLPELIPPTPAEAIQAWPVSRQVSYAANEGEALTARLSEPPVTAPGSAGSPGSTPVDPSGDN